MPPCCRRGVGSDAGPGARWSRTTPGADARWCVTTPTGDGDAPRVRQGWYAIPGLPAEALDALRVGGSLTSTSAARLHGLWALDDDRLHIAVPRNGARLRGRAGTGSALATTDRVCVHWRSESADVLPPVSPVIETLLHAIECQTAESALTMIDSALNQRRVTRARLLRAVAGMPRRYAQVVAHSDAGCQSGTETLVRLRLQRLGIRVRAQFFRQKVGHVDLLVGERLVIECDSGFHDTLTQVDRDYDRDIELIDEDYLVLRLRYRHIVYEWPRIEAMILRLIRRRAHLWPRQR